MGVNPKGGNSSSLINNKILKTSISPQIISDNIIRTYTSIKDVHIDNHKNIDPDGRIKVTYKSAIDCARHIFNEEGYRGFLRGLTPRMMQHAPAVAISWTTYETMKKMLSSLK